MRPLTVITGIVLGSCLAITVSLSAVLIVYIFLGDEYPRVQREFGVLIKSVLIFVGMTTISAVSFYALLTKHKCAGLAQIGMWAGLTVTAWYFLP